ncbi:MAG TPA: dihydrofolate reductase family protein [Thermoleophilaceae bacterium]
MRKLVYSLGVSLDGYIAGPGGDIGWSAPGEELHRFHNEQARATGVQLYGRRLYETMLFWETADAAPDASPEVVEFARIWRDTPKLVFSTTLTSVEGSNTELAQGAPAAELARLKDEPGMQIAVGGAGLAATFIGLDLVDEYGLFLYPALVGGGTRLFPPLGAQLDLRLVETRTFDSGVVYLRYERAR